jgi:adenylate cyclase
VTIALGGALHDRLDGFATLEIDQVRVVGRDRPETLYTLLGDESLATTPAFLAFAAAHAALLTAYRTQQWVSAQQALGRLERSAAAYGLERLYALYRERIGQFEQNPPQDGWDGVFTAVEKTG